MASNLYVRDLCNQLHKLDINEPSLDSIKHHIQQKCSIPIHHQQLWHNGKLVTHNTSFTITPSDSYNEISLSLSLSGGKGGFGSMLRAAGKLNKTTNKSAMRDLSGRRHRFVQQENELRDWIKQQKSSKPMSAHEIQSDYRHIKQYGTLPEKRMCHRGVNCRYKYKCKFRHPDDITPNTQKHKKKAHKIAPLHHQTDEEMRNALLMGKINAKHTNYNEKQNKKAKKIIPLFGGDVAVEEDIDIDIDNNNDINIREILHKYHPHELKCIIREDCDFVICDFCMKQFKGPSWHCSKSCDFDLCDDCVVIDIDTCMNIPMDTHLREYYAETNEMKHIQQTDQNSMEIKAFSLSMDRKRKRKEKKLNLLGLENVKKNRTYRSLSGDNNDNDNVVENKCTQRQRLKGEINNGYVKDPNEIVVDMDLLFPDSLMNGNNKVMVRKGDIELDGIKDVDELKRFGMEKLKKELQFYGLKCGGTLQERAERLFLLKGNKLCDLPKNCFVSKKRKKKLKKPPRKKQKIVE